MSITDGIAFAVLGAVLFFILRESKSGFAPFVPLLGGILLFIAALLRLTNGGLLTLFSRFGIREEGIALVFKVLSVGFLTEAGADTCEELGAAVLAKRLIFFGNTEIFLLVLPTLEELLRLSLEYLS